MPHQALYRKWRPAVFADVVGQEHITRTLLNQLRTGRVSHAYLFTGSRGTGKTTCARLLAKAVNCENPQDGEPCNRCATCRAVNEGSLLDVVEIDAASNTGVDDIRELREEAIYAPASAKKKVYIIDEVHMLSFGAFNAFLKILEEPPEHVIFILATTELHKVPATILSRCQRFDFRRIPAEAITGNLEQIAKAEHIALGEGAAALIAGLADGAMRNALSILEQCASEEAGTLTVNTILSDLGLAGATELLDIGALIEAGNTRELLEKINAIHQAGAELGGLADQLATLFRDILLYKTIGENLRPMGVGYGLRELDRLAPGVTNTRLIRMIDLLQETGGRLSRSSNIRNEIELCLIKLCDAAFMGDIAALADRIERLEQRIADGAVTGTAPRSPAAQEPDTQKGKKKGSETRPAAAAQRENQEQNSAKNTKKLREPVSFLPELMSDLKKTVNIGVYSHLRLAQLAIEDNELLIICPNDMTLDMLKNSGALTAIGAAASARAGRNLLAKPVLKSEQPERDESDNLNDLLDFGMQHPDTIKIDDR